MKCGKGQGPFYMHPCRNCLVNTYVPEGEKDCRDCPLTMVVTDTRTKCVYCEPSFFRQAYEVRPHYEYSRPAECLKCAAGTYSGLQDTGCHECPAGSTVNAAQTGCEPTPTPAPTVAPTHQPTSPTTDHPTYAPVSCVFGEYYDDVSHKCVVCTEGDAYAGKCTMKCGKGQGPFYVHPCRKCVVNTYVPEGETNCRDCPLTMVVTDERTKCVYCEPSFFRQAYEVKPWYQYSQPAECLKCAPGTYSGFQDTGCRECPAGSTVNAAQTGCEPNSTPTPSRARTPAPTLYSNPTPTYAPVSCVFGERYDDVLHKCVVCTDPYAYAGKCKIKCDKGQAPFYVHSCRKCVVNTYVPEGKNFCYDCPLTMVVTDERTKCVYCEPSFYRYAYEVKPWFQYSEPAVCKKCPAGTYSGFQDTGCHECPADSKMNAAQTECKRMPTADPTSSPSVTPTHPSISPPTGLDGCDPVLYLPYLECGIGYRYNRCRTGCEFIQTSPPTGTPKLTMPAF